MRKLELEQAHKKDSCASLSAPQLGRIWNIIHVAAQPNLSADGAFILPPTIALVGCEARLERVGFGGFLS